jgi:hypothetical protein
VAAWVGVLRAVRMVAVAMIRFSMMEFRYLSSSTGLFWLFPDWGGWELAILN